MGKHRLAKLIVTVGGVGLSLTFGVGVATAEPDMSPVVNTTCTYDQAMLALYDQSPEASQELAAYPASFGYLKTFFNSAAPQREQLIQQAKSLPAMQRYLGLMVQIANSCHRY
jgi:hemophore-related protein